MELGSRRARFGRVLAALAAVSLISSACSSTQQTPTPVPATAPPTAMAAASATPAPAGSPAFLASMLDPKVNICGPQAAGGQKTVIKIAHMFDVIDSTQNTNRLAQLSRAAVINAACPNLEVEYTAYDAQSNVATQIAETQSVILTKPDVMIFSAVDTVGSAPAIQAAHNAGIKLIDVRAGAIPNPNVDVSFYASDEQLWSQATVTFAKAWVAANPGKMLNIGLIYGAAAQTPQLIREDALNTWCQQNSSSCKIVAHDNGNWLTSTAQQLSQDWLLAHPEMNWISCANDIMATGATNAVVSAKKTGQVMVSGYDLTDPGAAGVKAGTQTLDVGFMLGDWAEATDIAVSLALGTWTQGNTYTNAKIWAITKDNIDQYLAARKASEGY